MEKTNPEQEASGSDTKVGTKNSREKSATYPQQPAHSYHLWLVVKLTIVNNCKTILTLSLKRGDKRAGWADSIEEGVLEASWSVLES